MDPPPKPTLSSPPSFPTLEILPPTQHHTFTTPTKRIQTGADLPSFLTSTAYRDIGLFILQLNRAVCPRKHVLPTGREVSRTFTLDNVSEGKLPQSVRNLRRLLERLGGLVGEAPPDDGPRRFGNVSFRRWFALLEERVGGLLGEYVGEEMLGWGRSGSDVENEEEKTEGGEEGEGEREASAGDELRSYLLGGFGSAQRLDYGTGHELSFLAFLGCLWKLGYFKDGTPGGEIERNIVLGVFERYLEIVRLLIQTYNLEPAGSHGVWGLDDHSFLPYVFGSAQLTRPINDAEPMPLEGSVKGAPKTADVIKPEVIERERSRNMYFSAVGFINDVKTGPFWEHSPILFDVSGVQDGWGKINKGMIKMFNAEVLSKFPVVQHFTFGSLFSWTPDPEAVQHTQTIHLANQPTSTSASTSAPIFPSTSSTPSSTPIPPPGAMPPAPGGATTAAPWAKATSMPNPTGPGIPYSKAPWVGTSQAPAAARGDTKARMEARTEAMRQRGLYPKKPAEEEAPACPMKGQSGTTAGQVSLTKAPWAKD